MILVDTLITNAKFLTDTASSDRYTYGRDTGNAINMAIDWAVGMFNAAFAQDKLSEEVLAELNYTRIFQASTYGRIYMNPTALGHQVWSVISVSPEPSVYPEASITPVPLPPYGSAYIPGLSKLTSQYLAERQTQEQWDTTADNIFMPGNTIMTGQQKRYAYLCQTNYTGTFYQPGGAEISIRPFPPAPNYLVAISYLKTPTKLTFNVADLDPPPGAFIEFPASMTDLITARMMGYISEQQGDGTNLWGTSGYDMNQFLQAFA